MNKIAILGAGGFARETLDVIDAINAVAPTWTMIGFIVDTQYFRPAEVVNNKPVLGDFDWLAHNADVRVVCGVGAPEVRHRMIQKVAEYGNRFATLIHPQAILTRWSELGDGIVIAAGCIVGNQSRINDHVHLNPGAIVGHDAVLDRFVSVAPGARISGAVHLKEGAYVGTGVNIIEKKVIGAWSIVGAGSTVIKDVPANSTVVGTPAQVIKQRSEGWHLDV